MVAPNSIESTRKSQHRLLFQTLQAAGADGVGSLQESSMFSTTAAELGVQSHCAEDEEVPQPEHEPADEASALSVLEVKEGEKDEETDEEKDKKKDEKDEDEELTASLVAGASVASDAEQPEGEPSSLDQAYGTEGPEVKGGVDYYEIGSDTEKENSSSRFLETPRTHGRIGRSLQPPTPITEHFMICNEEDGDLNMDVPGSEADGEDPSWGLGLMHRLNRNVISKLLQESLASHQHWEPLIWRL